MWASVSCSCCMGIIVLLSVREMSVVLTVISLGMRVLLAYALSAVIGEVGIWLAIPIGWVLADVVGLVYMWKKPLRFSKAAD